MQMGVPLKKSKWFKHQRIKKLALNLQLQTIQILTNDVQMLILGLSYFITTVNYAKKSSYLFFYLTIDSLVVGIFF